MSRMTARFSQILTHAAAAVPLWRIVFFSFGFFSHGVGKGGCGMKGHKPQSLSLSQTAVIWTTANSPTQPQSEKIVISLQLYCTR